MLLCLNMYIWPVGNSLDLTQASSSKACYSLESAAEVFIKEQTGKLPRRKNVEFKGSCEINEDCQAVLKKTYSCCNFANLLELDLTEANYCTTHGRYCKISFKQKKSRTWAY